MAQKKLKEIWVSTLPMDGNIIPVNSWNYQDSFLYGKSIEALDYNTQIKNKPVTATGTPFIGYFTITATGSKVITGVWFTPKMVQFFYTDQAWGSWVWSMTALSQFGHDKVSGTSIQTECIYLRDAASTAVCRATRTSLDTDGFTLNVTLNSLTNRVDYIATP